MKTGICCKISKIQRDLNSADVILNFLLQCVLGKAEKVLLLEQNKVEQTWVNIYLIRPAIQLSNYVLIIFYNLFLISYLICWKRCRVITYHVHNIVGILVNHTGSIFPKNDLKVKKWLKPGNYQCPTCRLPCGRCTHLWLWKLASSPMIHHWPLKL